MRGIQIALVITAGLTAVTLAAAQAPPAPLPPFARAPIPPGIAPLTTDAPQQANVTVKVVEFQATKGQETGLRRFTRAS